MRERKRKNSETAVDTPIHDILGQEDTFRDEIGGDVFELWLGISRLMAKVHGAREPLAAIEQTAKATAAKRPAVIRRPTRRRAA